MSLREIIRSLRLASRYPGNRLGLYVLAPLLLALLGVWGLVWLPVAQQHHTLQEQTVQLRQELVASMRLNELSNDYRAALQAVEAVETKLDRVIPLSEYVNRLNNLAQEHRLQIVSEARHLGTVRSGYLPIYQELVLDAPYESMRRFLGGLSSLPTWTVVRELRLSQQPNSTQLKANLVLVTFQKQSGETGS